VHDLDLVSENRYTLNPEFYQDCKLKIDRTTVLSKTITNGPTMGSASGVVSFLHILGMKTKMAICQYRVATLTKNPIFQF
jgi:hypothetical protein